MISDLQRNVRTISWTKIIVEHIFFVTWIFFFKFLKKIFQLNCGIHFELSYFIRIIYEKLSVFFL